MPITSYGAGGGGPIQNPIWNSPQPIWNQPIGVEPPSGFLPPNQPNEPGCGGVGGERGQEAQLLQQMMQLLEEFMKGSGSGGGCGDPTPHGGNFPFQPGGEPAGGLPGGIVAYGGGIGGYSSSGTPIYCE